MEDFEIIRLFQSRMESAVEKISEKYGKLCTSVIKRILPDIRDVEECLSDTWVRIWNSIPPDVPDSLKAYSAAIARNLALDRYNYNTAEKRSTALTEAFEELEPCLPGGTEMFGDVEDSTAFKLFINGFLEDLSKDNRIIFVKRYWYGCSLAEIAEEMDISESKVKSSLFRTRNRLLNDMREEGIEL